MTDESTDVSKLFLLFLAGAASQPKKEDGQPKLVIQVPGIRGVERDRGGGQRRSINIRRKDFLVFFFE